MALALSPALCERHMAREAARECSAVAFALLQCGASLRRRFHVADFRY